MPMFQVTTGRVTDPLRVTEGMQSFKVEMLSPNLEFRQEKMPVDFLKQLVTIPH